MRVARNVHFQIKPGMNGEFTKLFQNDVLPLLKQQKGFKEEVMLVDRDHGVGISLWDDRPSAEAYQSAGYANVLRKLTPVIDGTPRVETYEVAATTLKV